MKLTCFVILILLILFSSCEKKTSRQSLSKHIDIHHILEKIPEQDRNVLDSFIQLLSRDYDFSYTLFGNKPMSMACYFSKVTSSDLYHPYKFVIFEKGWEVWQSYALFFPSDEFILRRCKDSEGYLKIFLINKRHALQVISDNLATFQLILGTNINPHELVEQLCYSQQDMMEILNDNSALLGILLGYGKINSMNFKRKITICENLNTKMTPPFSANEDIKSLLPISRTFFDMYNNRAFSYPSKDCFPSSECASLADELNDILLHKDFFEIYGSDFFLDKIIAPVFAVRKDSPETKKLHEDYLATKQKVDQAYMHGSFLEITLNQWMYPQ